MRSLNEAQTYCFLQGDGVILVIEPRLIDGERLGGDEEPEVGN
jgi:hypothetical protein